MHFVQLRTLRVVEELRSLKVEENTSFTFCEADISSTSEWRAGRSPLHGIVPYGMKGIRALVTHLSQPSTSEAPQRQTKFVLNCTKYTTFIINNL